MGTGYTRNDTVNNIADGNVIDAADLDGEFDALQAAFNSSTGHTHDGTSAEGAPIAVTGPAQEYVSTATEFRPKTNNAYDLGSVSLQWKNLYVDGTANLDAVDIDGGTIDGTTIGGASAAVGTFTTANATTVDTTNLEVTNLKAKDGTAAGSIANSTGVVTLNSAVLTTADINGGTVDNVTIGGAVRGAGNFTTVSTTGNITVDGTVDGRDVAADGAKLDGIETGATADQTITAGAGLTGGGTGNVTISHADTSSQASVNNSNNTFIQDVTLDTYGHVTALTSANVSIGNATITLAAGTGLIGGGSFTTNQTGNGTITFNVDLNELSTSTTDGDGDFFVVVDTVGEERKLTKANINISGFNNDAGYTTNVGDITGVTAGTGLTGGGDSGSVTVSHADTSALSGVYGSTALGTKINQITLDGFGHITAITTGATGDIQGVTAGTGLTGGGTSGTVTLNVDVGTTANKIVQLDASARLPAVDGSQLTGILAGAGRFKGENGITGDTTNGAGDIFRINEQALNTNVTIDSDENASCTGPLTVASGVTLTVNGNLAVI